MSARRFTLLATLFALPLLAGCDQLGIETPAQTQARQDAEGRAIGSACRQTGRPLEECYARAQKDKKTKLLSKASIFNGWKEMDVYMRENNLAILPPSPEADVAPTPAAGAENPEGKPEGDKADAKDEGKEAPAPGKGEAPGPGKKISARAGSVKLPMA